MDAANEQPIVVIAPMLPEAPGEPAYSRAIVTEDDLAEALRVDDALKTVPGVSLFRRSDSGSANPTGQGVSVRSTGPSGAGRALVTLDGVPLNDAFGGWVIWGALAPESLSGATVTRGAGAGPYGAGALSGSIALSERTAQGAALDVERGERDFTRVSGWAGGQGDAVSGQIAALYENDDGWVPVFHGAGAADTKVSHETFSAMTGAQARFGTHVLSARLIGYDEERSAGLVGANSENDGAIVSLTFVSEPMDSHWSWRLQTWAQQSDLSNSSVSVAPDRSTATPANNQYETPASAFGGNVALRWSGAASGLELGADIRAAEGQTHELFSWNAGSGVFTRNRIAGGRTLIAGAYAEGWRNAGPYLFSGGVRVDSWRAYDGVRRETNIATSAVTLETLPEDNDDVVPTARLGVRRELAQGLYWRGAAYAGFRPPTLNELHRPFRVGNDVTEANPELTPEKLYGGDFGFGRDGAVVSWSIGAFVTRLVNPITNVTLGAGPGTFPPGVFVPAGGAYRKRMNAGAIDASGVEAEAHGEFGAAWRWRAALNYTDARVDGEDAAPNLTGLSPAQTPAWTAVLGLEWSVTASTRLSADLSYESGRFEDDLNTRPLSPAAQLDLRLDQKLGDHAGLFVALDNALDAEIETGQTADGVESFAAPRAARIGLRFTAS